MKKNLIKNQCGKRDVRPNPRPGTELMPLGLGGHPNQQDNIQTNRRKTKVLSLMGVMCGR